MLTFILLTAFTIVCWRLIKLTQLNHQHQQFIQQNYPDLGQSIAALNIQLQVASKLWHSNPSQAQRSLNEAHTLSKSLMQEIRQTVKTLNAPTQYDSFTSRR